MKKKQSKSEQNKILLKSKQDEIVPKVKAKKNKNVRSFFCECGVEVTLEGSFAKDLSIKKCYNCSMYDKKICGVN